MSTTPAYGFREVDGVVIWGNSQGNPDAAAIVYRLGPDGDWVPFTVFTLATNGCDCFDCELVGGEIYHHESGGGWHPYVHQLNDPGDLPGRIWIRDGVSVHDGSIIDGPGLDDQDLLARGYLRVEGDPDPFEDSTEGETFYCPACPERVVDDDAAPCCLCDELAHTHVGSLIAVADADEACLAVGLFEILKFPFYSSGVGGGRFLPWAIRWVSALPDRVNTFDYAAAPLCADCSRVWSCRAARWPRMTAAIVPSATTAAVQW